jgi:hypothetical protein
MKLLEDNEKAWDSKLKFSLWDDRVTTKRSLGFSHFHLVYGVEAIFPTYLSFPVETILQNYQGEPVYGEEDTATGRSVAD